MYEIYFSRLQKPVRIMLDRNEDMLCTGGRHPFLGSYKVGFTSGGQLTALDLQLYANGGISLDLSVGVSATIQYTYYIKPTTIASVHMYIHVHCIYITIL